MGATESTLHPDDIALQALALIARHHGIATEIHDLRHKAGINSGAFSESDLALSARRLGLKARIASIDTGQFRTIPCPALVFDKAGQHFLLLGCKEERALVLEPNRRAASVLSVEDVTGRATGRVMLVASRQASKDASRQFDFTWFIPAIIKYRALLTEVLAVSLVLQVIGLISPLMFQVVMDKVLTNRAYSTLNVVVAALLLTSAFEVVLTGLRSFLLSHTTNRIDVELGAGLFRHLLSLPLPYFAARRIGDTVARVRELENVRNFLTGQALTAVIDLFFSVVYLAVMCLYSARLTLIVAASLPLYAGISALLNPAVRARLNEKFARGAENQSFLVESMANVEAIKAMAIEPQLARQWESQLAAYVTASFRVTTLGTLGQQLIQLIGKLVSVLTLLFGAKLVIDGHMTVGALIAFNMMSQRVAAPVLRLAQLWQDFQQVGISVQRLGDVLNSKAELQAAARALPPTKGEIVFDHVRFRYRGDSPPIIDDFCLHIQAGEVIGVVGRSGSGKSTMAKLLQRLYVPEHGHIKDDGIDLALADAAWLRRQVGVVLQDNQLFGRSIRENIAIADPATPLDHVIHAAKLAGAHDFICELPEGYETMVGERGSTLSGGQRQRLAIARALIGNPKVLIFDEATSALDVETEGIVQRNMRAICDGRTVIVIAHRLSAVRHAHRIIAMDRGRIVEQGDHASLMAKGGYYANLLALQAA